MDPKSTILTGVLLFRILTTVWGNGCASIDTHDNTVIDMCEQRNWTFHRLYLSITTASMGSSTKCYCALRAKTSGLETSASFVLRYTEWNITRCNQSLIHVSGTESMNISCSTPDHTIFHTGVTADDVTIVLSRLDTSVEVSYCLFVQPDRWQDNHMELTCQRDVPQLSKPAMISAPTPSLPFMTSSAAYPSGMVGTVVGGILGAIALIGLTLVASIYIGCRYMAQRSSQTQTGADNSAYSSLSDITRVNLRADPNYTVIQSERSPAQLDGNDATGSEGAYETVDGASSDTPNGADVNSSNHGRGDYNNV